MQRRVAEGRPRKSRTHSLTSRNSATVLLSFFFFLLFFKIDAASLRVNVGRGMTNVCASILLRGVFWPFFLLLAFHGLIVKIR